jgi:hypothetical protein
MTPTRPVIDDKPTAASSVSNWARARISSSARLRAVMSRMLH